MKMYLQDLRRKKLTQLNGFWRWHLNKWLKEKTKGRKLMGLLERMKQEWKCGKMMKNCYKWHDKALSRWKKPPRILFYHWVIRLSRDRSTNSTAQQCRPAHRNIIIYTATNNNDWSTSMIAKYNSTIIQHACTLHGMCEANQQGSDVAYASHSEWDFARGWHGVAKLGVSFNSNLLLRRDFDWLFLLTSQSNVCHSFHNLLNNGVSYHIIMLCRYRIIWQTMIHNISRVGYQQKRQMTMFKITSVATIILSTLKRSQFITIDPVKTIFLTGTRKIYLEWGTMQEIPSVGST